MNKNMCEYNKEIFTDVSDIGYIDLLVLKIDKVILWDDKLNGNITEEEKKNEELLYSNLKSIIKNIALINDKLVFKYSNKLSKAALINIYKQSSIIYDCENDCKNIDDLDKLLNVFLKINDIKSLMLELQEEKMKNKISKQ